MILLFSSVGPVAPAAPARRPRPRDHPGRRHGREHHPGPDPGVVHAAERGPGLLRGDEGPLPRSSWRRRAGDRHDGRRHVRRRGDDDERRTRRSRRAGSRMPRPTASWTRDPTRTPAARTWATSAGSARRSTRSCRSRRRARRATRSSSAMPRPTPTADATTLLAAILVAQTAWELFADPALVAAAWREFRGEGSEAASRAQALGRAADPVDAPRR